jgi:Na+/proline symporter
MSLYFKRMTRLGALTGMLYGGVVCILWPHISALLPMEVPALIPGFLLNLPLIYLVSSLTQRLEERRLAAVKTRIQV